MRIAPDIRREVLNIAGSVIGLTLVGLLAFCCWALIYKQVPEANQNALTLVIGILSANVGMVVGFYFGSSVTSKKNAETINAMAQQASQNPTDNKLTIPEGTCATATATSEGTVIEREPVKPRRKR